MKTLNKTLGYAFLGILSLATLVVPARAAYINNGKSATTNGTANAKTKPVLITVESVVKFDKDVVGYKNDKLNYANVVKLGFKVTNHYDALLPQPIDGNKPQFVKLYINGQLSTLPYLYAAPGDKPDSKYIPINGSQIFYTDFLLTPKAGLLAKYGKKITMQWECLNVRSALVKVDLEKQTAHIINDNDNKIAMLYRR